MHLVVAGLVVLGTVTSVRAQENGPPLRRHDTTILQVETDVVIGASVKAGSVNFGPARTWTIGTEFLTPVTTAGHWQWDMGLEFTRREFKYRVNPGAPAVLQIISIPMVASYDLNEATTIGVKLNPGLYSDVYDLGLSDFNMPVGVRLYHEYAYDVMWFAGFQVDLLNEFPVIPDFGLRWRFWYDWVLDVGLPDARIEYEFSDRWTGSAGLEWRGGAYRVSRTLPASGGKPGTGNSSLTYRDLRVKVGLRYGWAEENFILLAGGYSFQRQLKFGDGNYQLKMGGRRLCRPHSTRVGDRSADG